jgi:hypothetical protein
MIAMIIKRLINLLVTMPILVSLLCFLWGSLFPINKWMGEVEHLEYGSILYSVGFIFSVILVLGGLYCTSGILVVITTGTGILWKRVEEKSFLLEKDGKIFKSFNHDHLIWRLDPIFRGRKLVFPSSH